MRKKNACWRAAAGWQPGRLRARVEREREHQAFLFWLFKVGGVEPDAGFGQRGA